MTKNVISAIALTGMTICVIAAGNASLAQKKNRKKSDEDYYKVPKSEYIMLENGKIYPLEEDSYEAADSVSDWDAYYDFSFEVNKIPETITAEKYTITFTEGDSFKNDNKYNNYFPTSSILDAKLLNDDKLYGAYFTKTDTSIVLKLAEGKTKTYFAPNFLEKMSPMMAHLSGYKSQPHSHQFQGYLKDLDAYLIFWDDKNANHLLTFYADEKGYLLVSRKDGSEIRWKDRQTVSLFDTEEIMEVPILSPDRKKILFVNSSEIRLYSVSENGFREEFTVSYLQDEEDPYGYGEKIKDAKWVGENSFLVQIESPDFGEDGLSPNHYKLVTFNKR